jgi:hypothetical protein
MYHRDRDGEVEEAVLGCHCCLFPVVAGIPVVHMGGPSKAALKHLEARQPELARRAMFGFDAAEDAVRFEGLASSAETTYREMVDALGFDAEGSYFFYRFSDPSFVVAHPITRAIGSAVLSEGGRAIDVCGGSGHLTRSLMDLSSFPPILADLYFAKIWLARRFTAPGCEAVCCDANNPLPFARGAFRYAVCADAFMYIWQKRLLAQEMLRLIDGGRAAGAVVVTHAHNERVWSPSHGNALPPEGYRHLFETVDPRIFAESRIFSEVVRGGPIDLTRTDAPEALDDDPALVIVATANEAVFQQYQLDRGPGTPGELRVNPLYAVDTEPDRCRLRLRFPTDEYEDEFGQCRDYLADELVIDPTVLATAYRGRVTPEIEELVRRRVILDLPKRYY